MFRKKIFSSVLIVSMTCISMSSAYAVADKDNPSADDKSVILSDKKESGTERNREVILKDLNRIREEKKLPALNINESLNKAAQDWSDQQAKDNELSAQQDLTDHYPNGWTKAAQTVASGGKAEDAVKLWKDSPKTLKYITDRKINSVGIGVAYAEDGTPYYTVNYAGYDQAPSQPKSEEESQRDAGKDREVILKDLNRIREEKKLPALNINESLNKAAQDWSDQQAKDNELSAQQDLTDHYPNGWTKAAQTVASGGKAEDAVKLWKDSPKTLKYITDRKINSVGIGVAYAEDGTPYYTVNYAGYKK